ncbi:MAG TPA: ribonuclease H-like domain-containing protein [Methanoregulaceae archaeon]|nr:ribonuclease H-like domain-containing protein [Methanoregulaceae archaeon]
MIPTPDFNEVSRHWKLSASETPGYGIIRNDSVFRAGFRTSPVFESQYHELQEMRRDLEDRYRDYDVGEVFSGESICNPEGSCFRILTEINEEFIWPASEVIRKRLMNDLTLVRGIGPVKAKLLRKRGYRTVEDLTQNKIFHTDAEICADIISHGTSEQVVRLIRRWYPPSHPLVALSSTLYGRENFLFVDLETLGFFSRPIILFGLAGFQNQKLVIQQYLVRDMEEELAALSETIGLVMGKPVVVSFNGKAFDLPYLVSRSAFYGASPVYTGLHIDLLHVARRLFRGSIQDCRLGTIERYVLDIDRRTDIPGSFVPEFYESYQRTGNPGPLIPVVEHNREDIVTLARLLAYLSGGGGYGS